MNPSPIMSWLLRVGASLGVLVGLWAVCWEPGWAGEKLAFSANEKNSLEHQGGSGQANFPQGSGGRSMPSAGGRGTEMADAVRALAKALEDPDPGVRESAVYALRSMGESAKGATAALGRAVQDRDGYVRAIAGRTLARFGQAAVPTLVELLADPRAEVRLVAVEALRTMGEEAKDAVDALARAMQDPSPAVRETAAHALRELGLEAKPALEALQAGAADQDGYVRSAAVRALVRIGPAALPTLAELLRHPDERVRRLAAEAIQAIGVEKADPQMKSPASPGQN